MCQIPERNERGHPWSARLDRSHLVQHHCSFLMHNSNTCKSDCSKSHDSVIPTVLHSTKTQGLSVNPSGGFVTLKNKQKFRQAAELCPLPQAAPHLAPAHRAHTLDELPGLQLEGSAPLHLLVPQLHCSPLLRAAKEAWCYLDVSFTYEHLTGIFLFKSLNIH